MGKLANPLSPPSQQFLADHSPQFAISDFEAQSLPKRFSFGRVD